MLPFGITLTKEAADFAGPFKGLLEGAADVALAAGLLVVAAFIAINAIHAIKAYNSETEMGQSGVGDADAGGAMGAVSDYVKSIIWLVIFAIIFVLLIMRGMDIFLVLASGVLTLIDVPTADQTKNLGMFKPLADMIINWGSMLVVMVFVGLGAYKAIGYVRVRHTNTAKAQGHLKVIVISFLMALVGYVSLKYGFAIINAIAGGAAEKIGN